MYTFVYFFSSSFNFHSLSSHICKNFKVSVVKNSLCRFNYLVLRAASHGFVITRIVKRRYNIEIEDTCWTQSGASNIKCERVLTYMPDIAVSY